MITIVLSSNGLTSAPDLPSVPQFPPTNRNRRRTCVHIEVLWISSEKNKKLHQRPCFPYGNNDLVKSEEKFQLVSMSYLYTLEFNCMNYKEEACLFHNNRQLYFIISFFRFQPSDGTPLFPFDLSTAADRWHQSFVLSVFHLTSFIILKSILFLSIINEMEPTPDGSS